MLRTVGLLAAALLSVTPLFIPAGVTAATATKSIAASDDASVIASLSTRNFGSDPHLRVDSSPINRSYLKFSLSSITGPITSATLRLVPSASASAGFDLRAVANTAWSESTVTYATRPAVGSVLAHSPSTLKAGIPISFNVTKSVQAGIRSFALTDRGSTRTLMLNSSEAAPSLRPTLVVTSQLPPPASPCGKSSVPAPAQHVIWIFMENHGYGQVLGSSSAPFENLIAAQCGVATAMHAETHPSLPNYIAATSGGTQGVADDADPSAHPLAVASIFSQVKDAGLEWRAYEESAPSTCALRSSNPYAVRHNPAAYYTGLAADCALWDIPMGTTAGGAFLNDLNANTLPAFSFVTPNLCNDTHDCSVATGDAWLKAWVARIVASPGYANGSTVIFVTWDEDEGAESNRIPTIVVSPSTRAGTASATTFSHYSLLKTTEELLGIATFLGHAGDPDTADMRAAFNL